MTLSLAIILILKFMPFIKFLKKNTINKKINLCQKTVFLTQEEEQQIVDAICVAEKIPLRD
jgi:hypothetical protein